MTSLEVLWENTNSLEFSEDSDMQAFLSQLASLATALPGYEDLEIAGTSEIGLMLATMATAAYEKGAADQLRAVTGGDPKRCDHLCAHYPPADYDIDGEEEISLDTESATA